MLTDLVYAVPLQKVVTGSSVPQFVIKTRISITRRTSTASKAPNAISFDLVSEIGFSRIKRQARVSVIMSRTMPISECLESNRFEDLSIGVQYLFSITLKECVYNPLSLPSPYPRVILLIHLNRNLEVIFSDIMTTLTGKRMHKDVTETIPTFII